MSPSLSVSSARIGVTQSSSSSASSSTSASSSCSDTASVSVSPEQATLLTSRLTRLHQRVDDLKAKFVEKGNQVFQNCKLKYDEIKKETSDNDALVTEHDAFEWYSAAIDWIGGYRHGDLETQVIRRIKADLADANPRDHGSSNPNRSHVTTIIDTFTDLAGLRFLISNHLTELQQSKERIRNKLASVIKNQPPSAADVYLSANCRSCRARMKGQVCDHCKFEVLIRQWEGLLYRHVREKGWGYVKAAADHHKGLILAGSTRGAHRAEMGLINDQTLPEDDEKQEETQTRISHEIEIALKSLQTFMQQMQRDRARRTTHPDASEDDETLSTIVDDSVLHLQSLALYKKECVSSRNLASGHRDQLSAFDEMNQTCTRIVVKERSEQEAGFTPGVMREKTLGVITSAEVPGMFTAYKADQLSAAAALRENLSKMHFLLTQMKKAEKPNNSSSTGTQNEQKTINEDMCPICQTVNLQTELETVVLSCGHSYCTQCILTLLEHSSSHHQTITCGICRKKMLRKHLTYVSKEQQEVKQWDVVGGAGATAEDFTASPSTSSSSASYASSPATNGKKVVGSWSTKIGEVVSLVLSIIDKNRNTKLLLFSEWKDCLTLCSQALTANRVHNAVLVAKKEYPTILSKFQSDPSIHVLLLPMKGSNHGLNLTIASHVIIVEPSLSLAVEQQCIGRIYRMGQTKETMVHRMIVKNSVEERIRSRNNKKRRSSTSAAMAALSDSSSSSTTASNINVNNQQMEDVSFEGRGSAEHHLTNDDFDSLLALQDDESNAAPVRTTSTASTSSVTGTTTDEVAADEVDLTENEAASASHLYSSSSSSSSLSLSSSSSSSSSSWDAEEQLMAEERLKQRREAAYWNALIHFNGRAQSRERVLMLLQRNLFYERKRRREAEETGGASNSSSPLPPLPALSALVLHHGRWCYPEIIQQIESMEE